MATMQAIRAVTTRDREFDIMILEDRQTDSFKVVMSDLSLPAGSRFTSGDAALAAALCAIRGVIPKDERFHSITPLQSAELVGRGELDRLVFCHNADYV